MHVCGTDMAGLQAEEDQMRREAARVRKLYPLQEDVLRLSAAASERKTLRGDQDRPETPPRCKCRCECATTEPRARPPAP